MLKIKTKQAKHTQTEAKNKTEKTNPKHTKHCGNVKESPFNPKLEQRVGTLKKIKSYLRVFPTEDVAIKRKAQISGCIQQCL